MSTASISDKLQAMQDTFCTVRDNNTGDVIERGYLRAMGGGLLRTEDSESFSFYFCTFHISDIAQIVLDDIYVNAFQNSAVI